MERWALEHWSASAEAGPALTVHLGADGLDFRGNPDPAAAEAKFHRLRSPRPPRYGNTRRRSRDPQPDQDSEDDSAAAAQAAAAGTAATVGGAGMARSRALAGCWPTGQA